MGTLNPNIPLMGIQPAPAPDPMAQYGQMVQLADLINQRKMRQQMQPIQMQNLQAESETRQLQLDALKKAKELQDADTAALQEAFHEAEGDITKISTTKAMRKVSPQTAISLQKELDALVESHAKRTKAELDSDAAKDEDVLRYFGGITDQSSLNAAVDALVRKGSLPAGEGAEIVRGGYSPEAMKALNIRHKTSASIAAEAFKAQELKNAEATGRKTAAEAAEVEAKVNAQKSANPAEWDTLVDSITGTGPDNSALNARTKSQVRFNLKQPDGLKLAQETVKAAAAEVRQLEVATNPRVTANKIQIIKEGVKARASGGGLIPPPEELAANPDQKYTLDDVPGSVRPMVENALKYQSALPPQSRLNPVAQATRWWTMKLDKNYSEDLFPARNAAVKSMSSGKSKDKLDAMNTVLGHVGVLDEAVDALKNNDLQVLNQIANSLGVATGSVPQVVFKTIVHRVGPELTQAYVGSGGEAAERKEAGGDFNVDAAPEQIQGAAHITAKLLSSKMGATLFSFKRAAHFAPEDPRGTDLISQFFTPEAISVMDRMFPGWKTKVEPGAGGAAPKTGEAKPQPAAGGAKTYKHYAQQGNIQIGSDDGTTWYNTKTGKEWK